MPRIAIIIDDLGNQRRLGHDAVALPGPVAMAFLPHTPFARELAAVAHAQGKEILLHLPMQAADDGGSPGPGTITLDHSRREFAQVLRADLQAIPHVSGINNHMGSLLTRHPGHMGWLMEELKQRPELFFVDSYTTHLSVALQLAREFDVPALKRDVFLDRVLTPDAMNRELQRLKNLSREQGFAIGIGHPFRLTLEFLAAQLPLLARQGYTLVPVSSLLPERARQKVNTWHAYSSP
jgi:polysaccharide deacetylase 2 family uncharacterized protein YibQ